MDQRNGSGKRRNARESNGVPMKRQRSDRGPSPSCDHSLDLHPCVRGRPGGRRYTVSIALPGSVLLKQPTLEQKSLLASRVARAAAVFRADEVVVFDEGCGLPSLAGPGAAVDARRALRDMPWQPAVHLALLLQYLECPQYLRRRFFPRQAGLARAGVCDPLALPSHVAAGEPAPFREGAVASRDGPWASVDVGLRAPLRLRSKAPVGARVTVRMEGPDAPELVPPYAPRRRRGIYWGFSVRLANGLGGVWRHCPFAAEDAEEDEDDCGYDLVLGTSERGTPLDRYRMPAFRHLLVVFGGPDGLEASLRLDASLPQTDPRELFNAYLNTCPDQGSRTIRTEEAILVSLAAMNAQIEASGAS